MLVEAAAGRCPRLGWPRWPAPSPQCAPRLAARAVLVVRSGCPRPPAATEGDRAPTERQTERQTERPHRGDEPRPECQNPQTIFRQNKSGSPRALSTGASADQKARAVVHAPQHIQVSLCRYLLPGSASFTLSVCCGPFDDLRYVSLWLDMSN